MKAIDTAPLSCWGRLYLPCSKDARGQPFFIPPEPLHREPFMSNSAISRALHRGRPQRQGVVEVPAS